MVEEVNPFQVVDHRTEEKLVKAIIGLIEAPPGWLRFTNAPIQNREVVAIHVRFDQIQAFAPLGPHMEIRIQGGSAWVVQESYLALGKLIEVLADMGDISLIEVPSEVLRLFRDQLAGNRTPTLFDRHAKQLRALSRGMR